MTDEEIKKRIDLMSMEDKAAMLNCFLTFLKERKVGQIDKHQKIFLISDGHIQAFNEQVLGI